MATVWVANVLGLEPPQVSLSFALFSVFPLALIHRQIEDVTTKHLYSLICGLSIAYYTFGNDIIHLLITPIVVYGLLIVLSRKISPFVVTAFLMVYMSYGHIERLLADNRAGGLDWTLPYMIYVCKLGAFAWDYYDGDMPEDKVRKERQSFRIVVLPSALEYFAFVFFFAGYLTGPFAGFNEYKTFTDRTMFKETKGKIPSSLRATLENAVLAFAGVILVKIHSMYHEKYTLTEDFLTKPLIYRLLYVLLAVETGSSKYYFAWGIGQAAACAVGISYNGLDENKNPKWDRIVMLRLWTFKTATNAKGIIDNWNIPCQHWLKYHVFFRLIPVFGTRVAKIITFVTSAFWHGFYPGYYLFFISGAFLEPIAQLIRDNFRWRFMNADGTEKPTKILYDIVGWIVTFYTIDYLTIAFRLLDYSDGITVWRSVYFIVHVIGFILFVSLTLFGVKPKREKRTQ